MLHNLFLQSVVHKLVPLESVTLVERGEAVDVHLSSLHNTCIQTCIVMFISQACAIAIVEPAKHMQ